MRNSRKKLDWNTFLIESFGSLYGVTKKTIYTFSNMFSKPGISVLGYIKGTRSKFQNPAGYFFGTYVIYQLLGQYVYKPNHWYVGTLLDYNQVLLFLLMIGLSYIGWLISGKPNFSWPEVCWLFCFIYGTTFILSIIIVPIQAFFIVYKRDSTNRITIMILDAPVAGYIFLSLLDFFRAAKIPYYKYVINFIFGFAYYYGLVFLLKNFNTNHILHFFHN